VYTQKTGKRVAIPILPVFERMLRNTSQTIDLTNRAYNTEVRELLEFVGLVRDIDWVTHKGGVRKVEKVRICDKISAHDMRRSAATAFVLPPFSLPYSRVMPITGHETESQFKKYIDIGDRLNAAYLSEEFQTARKRWLMAV
jgi:hypothetical protein